MFQKTKLFLFILVMWCALFQFTFVFAGETGKIAGSVIDKQTGAPLAGANVVVISVWQGDREIAMDRPIGAATDLEGQYFILNVRPGYYSVKTSYMGYNQEIRIKVQVKIDRTTKVDFQMTAQAIEGEEVVVTAYRPEKVEKDLTATKQTYDVAEVMSIAGVEDISDILELQADVVDDHFRGGRIGESMYLVGGAAIVNPLNNQRAFRPIVTGLEQVEVYTSGFSAEYGNAQSGVVNMVTKEGKIDLFDVSFSDSTHERKKVGQDYPFLITGCTRWWRSWRSGVCRIQRCGMDIHQIAGKRIGAIWDNG